MGRTNLHMSIKDYAKKYSKRLRENSSIKGTSLSNSITYEVDENGAEIKANSYFPYVDKGVNGKKQKRGSIYSYNDKKPPISSLREWANKRSINVFALQTSIYNKGTKPKMIIENTEEPSVELITDGYINDIIEEIKSSSNGNR